MKKSSKSLGVQSWKCPTIKRFGANIIFLRLNFFVFAQNQHACEDQGFLKYLKQRYVKIALNLKLKHSLSHLTYKEKFPSNLPKFSLIKPSTTTPISIANTNQTNMSWGVQYIF